MATMTKEELSNQIASQIRATVGEEVEAAWKRIEERRASAGAVVIPERVDIEAISGQRANDVSLVKERRAIALGGALIVLARAKMDLEKAQALAVKDKEPEPVRKILTAGEAINGGVLINPEHSQELIDLLAPRTAVRRHIGDVQDVSSGSLDIPRLTADAATSWGGEIEEIREGQPTFDQLVMRPHQHKVLVPLSNTMLRRGGPRVATIVRNSTLRSIALGEDRAFLTSSGSEHRPKGLKYWAPTQNRLVAQAFTGTAAEKLQKVTDDLGRLVLTLEEQNVPMTNPVWVMAPRTRMYLMTARDGNGNLLFYNELQQGRLWGWPVESTTHVARNEGVGLDESTVYLFDADEFMLGQGISLQIDMSSEGTFVDVDGNVVSAFQRNLTLLRVINEVDFKPKHAEAVAYLTGVKWSPTSA